MKFNYKRKVLSSYYVAPFVGAWIEIVLTLSRRINELVAPFVGAWIEIFIFLKYRLFMIVAPFVGAWIEIVVVSVTF